MSTQPCHLYVITAYDFNHKERSVPIDVRFLDLKLNSTFYFVDDKGAPSEFSSPFINETSIISGALAALGKTHLAEWTFFLAELMHPFAKYPFYAVSSRFHEKNRRLANGISGIWAAASAGLVRNKWAYLPSYDRDAGFEDFQEYRQIGRLGMCDAGLAFVDGFWNVRIPEEYRFYSDFFCNYIGFRDRGAFEEYMNFYMPLINHFFTPAWSVRREPELYVRRRNVFRQEKPFTLFLEMVSHIFFYKNNLCFSGIKHDGLYDVYESETRILPVWPHL